MISYTCFFARSANFSLGRPSYLRISVDPYLHISISVYSPGGPSASRSIRYNNRERHALSQARTGQGKQSSSRSMGHAFVHTSMGHAYIHTSGTLLSASSCIPRRLSGGVSNALFSASLCIPRRLQRRRLHPSGLGRHGDASEPRLTRYELQGDEIRDARRDATYDLWGIRVTNYGIRVTVTRDTSRETRYDIRVIGIRVTRYEIHEIRDTREEIRDTSYRDTIYETRDEIRDTSYGNTGCEPYGFLLEFC